MVFEIKAEFSLKKKLNLWRSQPSKHQFFVGYILFAVSYLFFFVFSKLLIFFPGVKKIKKF